MVTGTGLFRMFLYRIVDKLKMPSKLTRPNSLIDTIVSNNGYRQQMPYANSLTHSLSYPKSRDAIASKIEKGALFTNEHFSTHTVNERVSKEKNVEKTIYVRCGDKHHSTFFRQNLVIPTFKLRVTQFQVVPFR